METKNNTKYFIAALAGVTVLVFYPVLNNDFLYFWDDQWVVMNQYTERGFTPQNLWAILTEFYHGQYAPANELLYTALYSIFGYSPVSFHATCLALHIINVCIAFFVMRQLLLLTGKVEAGRADLIAFLAAMIFAVHPFNVESIAWVSASKILVYSLFYLLATCSFLLYLKQNKLKYYLLTLFLFVFAFLGKEQAVTFPAWMLLIYWITGHSFRERKLWIATVPFILLSLVFGIITMLSQSAVGSGALSGEASYPLWQRIVYACYAFTEYLQKSILPFKLSYLYPFPSVIGGALPSWLLVYPTLLTVIAASFWKYLSTNKIAVFSIVFFLIHIAVALHIIPLSRFAVVADRYVYISLTGICLAISYLFVYVITTIGKHRKTIAIVLLCGYCLYCGVYSNLRCRVWHDTETLKKELREQLQQRDDYKDNPL